MGEFFFKRLFVLFFLVCSLVVFSVGVFSAAHPLYSDFSSAGSGFSFNRDNFRVSVSDTIIYNVGYFSVNGSSWQSFSLTGNVYNGNINWISGSSTRTLPSFGVGEHYVIVYSCTYNSAISSWDCHDNKWQLIVFSVNETSTSNITMNIPYELVISDVAPDCGDVLDYQCGTRIVCNENVDYGNCSTGYNCNNNLCVASDNLTCSGVVCPSGEYCSRGVCLLTVPGDTYFVALWGDDSNPGTFEAPFYHWQRAVEVSRPGDITYFRGGVWQPTTRSTLGIYGMRIAGPGSYNTAVSGTAQAPIRYYNYPGEKPIIDGRLMLPDEDGWNTVLTLEYIEYIYLKGLTIRHIYQSPPNLSRPEKPYSEAYGISSASSANLRFENCVVHNIDGRGFQHWSGAWTEKDAPNSPFEEDHTVFINCDSYNIFDRYDDEPGNAADGFYLLNYQGNTLYIEGCRAWKFGDDGFNLNGNGYNFVKNSWSTATEKYKGGSFDIEANGFKIPAVYPEGILGYELNDEVFYRFENCIAADNNGSGGIGFYNNIQIRHEGMAPNRGHFYNNFAYRNGIGYFDMDNNESVYRNNMAYYSQQRDSVAEENMDVGLFNIWGFDGIANTWVGDPFAGDWWWEYNPDYEVTDEDFVSLDVNQLMRPRKADGSLPDIAFGHLAKGSDLIDGGIVISGHHCSTVGAHPGQNCREWYGSAPDLGPFESNY